MGHLDCASFPKKALASVLHYWQAFRQQIWPEWSRIFVNVDCHSWRQLRWRRNPCRPDMFTAQHSRSPIVWVQHQKHTGGAAQGYLSIVRAFRTLFKHILRRTGSKCEAKPQNQKVEKASSKEKASVHLRMPADTTWACWMAQRERLSVEIGHFWWLGPVMVSITLGWLLEFLQWWACCVYEDSTNHHKSHNAHGILRIPWSADSMVARLQRPLTPRWWWQHSLAPTRTWHGWDALRCVEMRWVLSSRLDLHTNTDFDESTPRQFFFFATSSLFG